MDTGRRQPGSIVGASLWMLLIALLLFWAPFVGPLLAGVVGGRKAREVGRAIVAVFLPALVLALVTFLLTGVLTGLPVIGFVAGLGTFAIVASNVGPMLLGAILGALLD